MLEHSHLVKECIALYVKNTHTQKNNIWGSANAYNAFKTLRCICMYAYYKLLAKELPTYIVSELLILVNLYWGTKWKCFWVNDITIYITFSRREKKSV